MADHGVVAPGVQIYSSYKGGTYATASGTSMATPAVAGAAALMLGVDQNLTPQQIRSSLFQNSCKQATTPSCPAITVVPSSTYGSGRIDTLASVNTINPEQTSPSGDFSLSASAASISIPKGKCGSLTITANSINSFTSLDIALSATSSNSGIRYSFSPDASLRLTDQLKTDSSTLTINVPKNALPGQYTLTVTAEDKDGSGNNGVKLKHSIQIALAVTKR